MSEFIEFGLLGPLLVRKNGAEVPIRRGHPRAVLALLLLDANQVVPIERITDELWGSEPPLSAPVAVRSYIRSLRLALGDADRQLISTQPRGYLIRVADDELDVARFERLMAATRAAVRDSSWREAAAQAREALSLWRGEPLADIEAETMIQHEAPRLAELRLQAVEIRIDADIRLGGHGEVIAELRRLCDAHPLREHLLALLMLALYRCGRQSDALASYQRARAKLVEELGVEPGTELSQLHQRILAADPALAGTGAARPEQAEPRRDPPRELPPAVPGFTGRSAELKALTRLLDRSARSADTVLISALGGTAGVGKTALAVHWAHQATERFPDGELYVNLRGYDPAQPMPPADALAAFLRSLGVPGQDIPPDEDERAARYRSLLAGKRMLIVLDNAGSADQVRPLLPGTPAATVLVTSRDTLAGLVARDGASRLDLDALPIKDAIALLRLLIGVRVDAEPEATAELAEQCCRLPLALRVAAELTASRPAASLAELAAELADLHTRLDLLATDGDPRTQVRSVFSWSYRHLDAETARTFRLLGLHPGSDIESYAAAALTGTAVSRCRRALESLARAHLIQPVSAGRYGMHDLLRGYARELTTEDERSPALTRLFDHYLHTAGAAMDILFPAERHRRPHIPWPATQVPPLPDSAAAREWLDAERAVLVAVAGHTTSHDWPDHAIRLAATLTRYLANGGHTLEAFTIHGHALSAARRTGDRSAEATALIEIGIVDWQLSRLQEAAEYYQQALVLFRAAGDRIGEARAVGNIGLAELKLGRYEQAVRHQEEAVAIYRDTGDRVGEARALAILGTARNYQGQYQEAADYRQQTLDLCREIGDSDGEAWALAGLGVVALRLGRHERAAGYLQQALALFTEIGSTIGKSETLVRLGDVYLGLGRHERAADAFERALAMFQVIGDPEMESEALNGLGDVLFKTGAVSEARTRHATALRLASQADLPLQQARAHSGLARACQADGDSVQARHHWQEALARYDAIGAPEADALRSSTLR